MSPTPSAGEPVAVPKAAAFDTAKRARTFSEHGVTISSVVWFGRELPKLAIKVGENAQQDSTQRACIATFPPHGERITKQFLDGGWFFFHQRW